MHTDRDIKQHVTTTLTDYVDEHDIDGIVREIIDRYGLVDPGTIDDDEYWELIKRHAKD